MWTLWAGDPKNLHNSFFVKNFYLHLNFFEVLQIALLKKEKKNFSKKDSSHLKIAWHSQIQKKSIEKKRKKNEKREKFKQQQKMFFYFFLWENIFCKLILYFLHLYYSFFVWWLLEIEQSNTNARIDMHCSYRRSTSNQNTWQQTRYFNVDFDSNGLLFLFSYTPEKCL